MNDPKRHLERIPLALQAEVFIRNGRTCQMCGATPEDVDPDSGLPVTHKTDFVLNPELGGDKSIKNLRVLCSCCFEGSRRVRLPKPDRIHLLSQIRRATIDDQQAVLDWLLTKFGRVGHKKE